MIGDWSDDAPPVVNVWSMPDAGHDFQDGEHYCDDASVILTDKDVEVVYHRDPVRLEGGWWYCRVCEQSTGLRNEIAV